MSFLIRFVLLGLLGMGMASAASCPRIVSQSPYITMALQWLDRASCIVGVSRYDRQLTELPRTGGIQDPDVDVLTELAPDLIITSMSSDADLIALSVPAGTRVARVGGFKSMDAVDAMMRDLARLSASPHGEQAQQFARRWRALASQSGARGERVLLLTACTGTPYSYGREHMLGDLFVHAGFEVLDQGRVQALRPGSAFEGIEALVAHHKPEIIFTFNRSTDDQCRVILGEREQRIIHLNGDDFLNPGPRQLTGLEALVEEMRKQ